MEKISETFNGIKVTLNYVPPSISAFVTDVGILMENKEGKKVKSELKVMNIDLGTSKFNFNIDRLFYEVLEHICIASEIISFEQYEKDMKILGDDKTTEELKDEHDEMMCLAKQINEIVTQDWVDSIRCYLYLLNYNDLWK